MSVEREVPVAVVYEGIRIDCALRLDLLVESAVIVEVKAAEKLTPLFDAQLLTYLKLTGHRVGFLANFNVPLIKDGIKRIIHSPQSLNSR